MFYFIDIYYRSLFFVFFNIILFFILYLYKELLLWIIVFPLFFVKTNIKVQTHFIYTHPTELFNLLFYIILIFTGIINFLYLIVMLLDFLKTSINKTKLFFFQKLSLYFVFFLLIFNISFVVYISPFLFYFFESYNSLGIVSLNLQQEFRIKSYVRFFIDLLVLFNFAFYFVIIVLILIFLFSFLFFLRNKKFLIFLNILLATLFSPPDVFSQLILFLVLSFLMEIFFFILLFKLKFNMVTY